jgi:hypothetical protein
MAKYPVALLNKYLNLTRPLAEYLVFDTNSLNKHLNLTRPLAEYRVFDTNPFTCALFGLMTP